MKVFLALGILANCAILCLVSCKHAPANSGESGVKSEGRGGRRVSMVKEGTYVGQTELDGSGKECTVIVHEREGVDFSIFGQGGIKSLTLSFSENLLVTGVVKTKCFNGIDSGAFCNARVGDNGIHVQYQFDDVVNVTPHVGITSIDQDGKEKTLIDCWRLAKN